MRQSATLGTMTMCAGVAFLCTNDAIAKELTTTYSPLQILFLRNIIALPFAIALARWLGGRPALISYKPLAHFLRGGLWIIAATMFFSSLSQLGLAEATALAFVAPILITALSALVLKEKVGPRRWLAVLVGFCGVLIVVRPGSATFQPASLLALGTAFFYALLMLGSRFVDARESVWTMLLYLTGSSAILLSFIVPFIWVPVRTEDWLLFAGVAIFGTAGITMITQAFRMAPASIIAPLDYTALIWASLLGWLFWGDLPDLATYLGAAIIAGSGIFIVLREARTKP
ncbi:DMT family transporter [Thioclava sp. A2]|uniref:DMT family transporter n=1 Tax=Thioclava sp. FCG-A2 TaxID=3080562 RepID=UPI002955347A|nr:DMT family transporter [Thioclava sp. A2]MDV7270479.1 DMT family transporter [Thioclava sp. A2]